MFISLKDCLEEKILLERKLAVALGLLATCKMDLEACQGEEEGKQRGGALQRCQTVFKTHQVCWNQYKFQNFKVISYN